MEKQDLNLRAYFLGQLTDDVSAATELRILSDANLEEKLHFAESELIEDYLDGMLAPDEKSLFDKNFLVTGERKKRVDLLKSLKEHAREVGRKKEIHSLKAEEKPSFFDSLNNFFSLKQNTALLMVGLILIVVIGFSWIFFVNNSEKSEFANIENSARELNRKDFSSLADYQRFSTLTLFSGSLRSSGSKNNLAENNLTDTILLRLTLPIEINSDKSYTARLIKNENILLSLDQIRSYQNQAGREVRLLLPKSVLTKGEYQVEIREETAPAGKVQIFYTFAVQ